MAWLSIQAERRKEDTPFSPEQCDGTGIVTIDAAGAVLRFWILSVRACCGCHHDRAFKTAPLRRSLSRHSICSRRREGHLSLRRPDAVSRQVLLSAADGAPHSEQAAVYKDAYMPNVPLGDAFALATAAVQTVPLLGGTMRTGMLPAPTAKPSFECRGGDLSPGSTEKGGRWKTMA